MDPEKKEAPAEAEDKKEPEDSSNKRKLPSSDFYAQLLHIPPCKRGGECNNCGRCER
jgi:hypothetical protein